VASELSETRVSATEFGRIAWAVADAARRQGLAVPGFRSRPGLPGQPRTIRRGRGSAAAIVAVSLRGRSRAQVATDLVDGVLAANGLAGAAARSMRARLLDAARASAMAA
jgi:hypothetical protein